MPVFRSPQEKLGYKVELKGPGGLILGLRVRYFAWRLRLPVVMDTLPYRCIFFQERKAVSFCLLFPRFCAPVFPEVLLNIINFELMEFPGKKWGFLHMGTLGLLMAPRSMDGFYALAGCTTPLDGTSRGCGSSVTYVHINVEVWTSGYQNHWDQIQEDFPTMAPKNLGNMGPVDLFQSVFFCQV